LLFNRNPHKHLWHWQQLAFANEVWQAAEQRKATTHLPHPAAPMPTVRPPTAQTSDRTPCQQHVYAIGAIKVCAS